MSPSVASTPTASAWWNPTLVDRGYQALVVHGTYPYLWGCNYRYVLDLHREVVHEGDTVLEIGPADGGHLHRVDRDKLDLHLMDTNPDMLKVAGARLARYAPTLHHNDATKPFPMEENSVDVVVLSMVLHCVRGSDLKAKSSVFDHIAGVLRPGGTFAGATVLSHGVRQTALSRAGLKLLNDRGVFDNRGDSLDDLRAALRERFDDVEIDIVGRVALWRGVAR
ncbi:MULTISPECIES: class I SAM-dependent methyltransferase [Nocardiopsis]|uniref:Methyltransferase domain-containing protein n=2 Tax=Nocardiopsis TaxID=2013 RepID=A0A7K2IU11_9ACTN|nr:MULTISPECIES: class I SAM-dependent methyltransferase [Nocardiopsis]AFA42320.1 methyltransferase [Nocardiopsis sp. CR167]MEC3894712.1 class I SAM-dependent methyltransferase [Nocardiopsis sp. LDBS1602]MYR33462.1 methyltransferase domain-containing protein [Nocardiopsis alba]